MDSVSALVGTMNWPMILPQYPEALPVCCNKISSASMGYVTPEVFQMLGKAPSDASRHLPCCHDIIPSFLRSIYPRTSRSWHRFFLLISLLFPTLDSYPLPCLQVQFETSQSECLPKINSRVSWSTHLTNGVTLRRKRLAIRTHTSTPQLITLS